MKVLVVYIERMGSSKTNLQGRKDIPLIFWKRVGN